MKIVIELVTERRRQTNSNLMADMRCMIVCFLLYDLRQ